MEKTISPGLKVTFLAGCVAAGIICLIHMVIPEAYQNFIGVPIKQPTEKSAFCELGRFFLL
jgi:hypothetical protein